MSASANLALPFIEGGELLPDVTLNETLRLIDTLVQLAIVDRDLNAPPGSPAEGQRWIVKASPSPTGAWAGHGNHVAAWQDGGWVFCVPQAGWFAYVIDESALVAWNGTAWVNALAMLSVFQNLALLGVGTTADATNPFSAKLNNALWVAKTVAEGGDGHLRYKLSKESAAKTLSLLFQDNFSGRAEIGLTGDDDFHFKVSADGSSWLDAITIDRTTGQACGQSGLHQSGRDARAALCGAVRCARLQRHAARRQLAMSRRPTARRSSRSRATPRLMSPTCFSRRTRMPALSSKRASLARARSRLRCPATPMPSNSRRRLRSHRCANGDYAKHIALIEGYRVARLGWGASGAQSLGLCVPILQPALGHDLRQAQQ